MNYDPIRVIHQRQCGSNEYDNIKEQTGSGKTEPSSKTQYEGDGERRDDTHNNREKN